LLLFFKKEVLFFFEKMRIASGDRENQKTFPFYSAGASTVLTWK